MKTLFRFRPIKPVAVGAVLALFGGLATATPPFPVITSIKPTRSNVLVEVEVPPGLREIVVEGRARFGRGTWEPRAVARTDGAGGRMTLALEMAKELEILRVKAQPQPRLPESFYTGKTSFDGPPPAEFTGDGGPTIYTTTGFGGIEVRTPTDVDAGSEPREVVESDIWKIRGQTLYYFNQYRGLQLVALENPDQPRLRGLLPLPAVGEQMYVLNEDYAVLLARESCDSSGYTRGRVMVVRVSADPPEVSSTLEVAGRLQESRLVGTALYVSSSVYRPVSGTTNTVWEYGTMVESFDLADPARPVARGQLWFRGQTDDVVAATDTFLFVANRSPDNYRRSVVHVVDITSPDGHMQEYVTVQPAGHVKDKFKLHYRNGVLTTISEDWTPAGTNRMRTRLETWQLPDPRSAGPGGVVKLGEVTLGYNESLHATRFDGTRAYIVTFFQVDPLWVVDLSDPSRPRIAGELEVPGWSTYIEPLGERLVAVGWEGSRVAVSLFDVSDPARPALFNKVLLGEGYSWSEANLDEKAFTVLPEAGLVLVPFGGYTASGYANQVQLIDLHATNLAARGVIAHQMQPRRATLHGQRILSISGRELITVDPTDRDHPQVTATLELSWPVSRVLVAGDHLLQIFDNRYGWEDTAEPRLYVTPLADLNRAVAKVPLGKWPVGGATLKDGRLYLLQTPFRSGWFRYVEAGQEGDTTNNFKVTVYDVSALPLVTKLGEYAGTHGAGWGQQWEPVWTANGLLVWVNSQSQPYFWVTPMLGLPVFMGRMGFWGWPVYGVGGGEMVAFKVGGPQAVEWVSSVNLGANGWMNFSRPQAQGNCIYLSHSSAIYWVTPEADGAQPEWEGLFRTRIDQRHYLDVVDFSDPEEPVVRKPVNIPGALIGLSHEGNVVYTRGPRYTTNGVVDFRQYVDAGAYDGTQFHLVASLALPESSGEPVVSHGSVFYLEDHYTATNASATLHAWRLEDNGQFKEWGTLRFAGYRQQLLATPTWLAVQMQGEILLVAPYAPLRVAGRAPVAACYAPNLAGADVHPVHGLFVPMDQYGVMRVTPAPILLTP